MSEMKIKKVKSVFFDKWLSILERKAFGWEYEGTEEEYSFTSEEISITDSGAYSTKTHHFITNLVFTRKKPYISNIFFNLTELLSNIFSAIRRFAVSILGPILIFFVVFLIVSLTACNDTTALASLKDLAVITAIIYGGGHFAPSIFFALLGFLLRSFCK